MATTRINFNNVISASSTARSSKSSLVSAKNNISSIGSGIDSSIKQRANIGYRIGKLSDDINYISTIVEDIVDVCNSGATTYRNVDIEVLGIFNKLQVSNVGNFTVGSVIGAGVNNQGKENSKNKNDEDFFKTWFEDSLIFGSIGGKTQILGVGVAGSLGGGILNGKVETNLKQKFDLENKEVGITASGEASGNVLQGEAEGNIGLVSGRAEGEILTGAVSGGVGATLFDNGKFSPNLKAEAKAGVSVAKGELEVKAGSEDYNLHGKAEGSVLTAEAEASAAAGKITFEDAQGNSKTGIGVKAEAKAGAYAAEGKVSGGFTILGVDIDVGVSGKAGGAGAEAGIGVTTGGVSGKLGAGLGVGAGLEISIDWSDFKLF